MGQFWPNFLNNFKNGNPSISCVQEPETTTMTETTTSAIDCTVSLGSNQSPVDGSFESLRSVASTSASPGLNADVTSGGWFNGVQSADSFLAPYVHGKMNVPESPEGGVFVGAAAGSKSTASWEESFYTTVESLVVGLEYTITFYQACTADAYGRSANGNQGAWEVTFGDETKIAPTLTYQEGPAVWTEVSLTFTPTSATQRLEFLAKDIHNAGGNFWLNYVLVDGIVVTPNVPDCTTTLVPSTTTTDEPTAHPTAEPTSTMPSKTPSAEPTSMSPSMTPSEIPSSMPSKTPSEIPTSVPSMNPSTVPSTVPTVAERIPKCVDISECYTLNFISTFFGWLEPIDQSNCVYRIQFSSNAEGTSALRPANPTHLRFFVDSNGDSQLEMGFLNETTAIWRADPISRVSTNEGGITQKMDLHWNNGGIYFASGFENIEGCGPSNAPTPKPTNDPCLNWVERFEYLDHVCAPEASVFDQSELPSRKMWTYSKTFGWYTLTQNTDASECRALCEDTNRCVTYAFQPTVGQGQSGCFLYSEENCAVVVSDGGYRIHDKVIDCSVTTSTTTTVQSTTQTTIDPQEAACPNGNTLDFLGNGRCADDGAIVDWPAAGYFLKTTKEDCLAQCEENADCTGAITAYNYYCAHYLSTDITMFDGEPSKYQTQWECHAKCHNVKREGTCNEFLVDYRIPRSSIYYTTRISGNPIDGWYLPAICAKECENDVQCKAFMFDTSGNTCVLGNSADLQECDPEGDFNTGMCGRPGRLTSGSCNNSGSDGQESVCPRGFIPHGEKGELNLHNHRTGAWPKVDTIEECAAYCETVSCVSFEYDSKSHLCATHTEADLDSRPNPAGWVACLLDSDAPSLAPTPASEGEECPIGFHQIGDLSANNDIGGYGMSTKDEVYTYSTFDDCVEKCESTPGCMAFNWNQAGFCVYYDSSVPNRDDKRGFLFCARDAETSTPVPECELSLGTDASPVDGSFESLRYAARTSANPGLNGNVNGAGWRNGMKTADSFLAPYVVGAINVPESPDGGVFAAGGAMLDNQGSDIWKESFYTTVEHLEAGAEYTVTFYQACTADPYGRSVDGNYAAWEVHFGDDMQMAPSLTYDSSIVEAVWSRVSVTFVASSESERLEFVSKALGGPTGTARWMNYILIDGITVSPNTPECADPTMAPSTSQPTMLPTTEPTTEVPTAQPTTKEPTKQPTELVQIPYNGPSYFCDTYQDPHVDTWHLAGSHWSDYRIDLAHTDAQLHRGDWLIFEYGAYQVIMSHAQQRWWNTHMYIKKSGAVIYSYSGRTAERVIDHSEVEVVTNPASTWVSNVNYRGYGSRYEYELVKLRNIPLEATWLQEKAYRDANSVEGRMVHGAILDVALKWDEDWRVTSGVCSATKATYAQFKLGDATGNRRELVEDAELETCPTLNQCCGRLAGLVNQFESCQLDNYESCCASGADPATCCGGWVQEAPRCSEDSCENGEACNFMDGYCYPEAEIAAVTTYKGTCHSQTDVNLDLELCSMDSGSLKCDQTMSTDECENGIAYLSKTIGGKRETTFYDSCEFEWYAEYSCQPPVLVCPSNYLQVGDFGAHIDGDELEMRLNIQTIEECKALCEGIDQCVAFTFARPGEELSNEFVCTLYDSVVPTAKEGSKIFCKSKDAPIVGTVAFDADFDFINDNCGELLKPLRQVVARVSRVELSHVRADVNNCESGSFTVTIDVESTAELEPLRETVEADVFIKRLNHELENHGKSNASTLNNVSTSEDSKSFKTEFLVVTIILCLLVAAVFGLLINKKCASKSEDGFDPEMGKKRQPEIKSEISLKAVGIPEFVSNSASMTLYNDVLGNSTTPRTGETTH
jgi:hypothetical protein